MIPTTFYSQFKQIATMMVEASKLKKIDTAAAIQSFSAAVTVAAQASNQSWPTVKIPYWESYGDRYMDMIKADHAALAVLVKGEDRTRYEQHMMQEHAAMMQESHQLHYGNLDSWNPMQFTPYIAKATPEGILVPDDADKDMYVPVHLNSPPQYESMNWNVATSGIYSALVDSAATDGHHVPPEIYTAAVRNSTHPNSKGDPMPFSNATEPHIRYFTAVLDQVPRSAEPADTADQNVVGFLTVAINFHIFTTGFLPDDVQGIMVVFRNSCEQDFTYVVNGKESVYLGPGDRHQDAFKSYEVTVNLTDHQTAVPGECLYTQVSTVVMSSLSPRSIAEPPH